MEEVVRSSSTGALRGMHLEGMGKRGGRGTGEGRLREWGVGNPRRGKGEVRGFGGKDNGNQKRRQKDTKKGGPRERERAGGKEGARKRRGRIGVTVG